MTLNPIAQETAKGKTLVTSIEIATEILKGRNMRGPCFFHDAVVTLEDGRKLPYRVESSKKKDLAGTVERKKKSIAAKAMTYDDSSGHGFFSETFGMGF